MRRALSRAALALCLLAAHAAAPLVERLTLPLAGPLSSLPSVPALCARARLRRASSAAPAPVLLLHGARFSAATWEELGTLDALATRGFSSCALDLGPALRLPSERASAFVSAVLDALSWPTAFVIAPSASGRLLWPFLATPAAGRLAGVVSIAAVGSPGPLSAEGRRLPALVVWGQTDDPDSAAAAAQVAAFEHSDKIVVRGAGHACYLDAPAVFHKALLRWLEAAAGRAGRGR